MNDSFATKIGEVSGTNQIYRIRISKRLMRSMPVWYHETYTGGIDEAARFPRGRYKLLRERLRGLEDSGLLRVEDPSPANRKMLLKAHDEDYVDRFLEGRLDAKERRRIGLEPWTDDFVPRTLRIMGGAVAALEHVSSVGGIAGNMAGGTHHSHRSFGSGYCVFNDLAVCALIARESHGHSRVAVLDLDVHQGDGTATILSGEEGILTISVHCAQNFPFRKATSDHDIPLDEGTGDIGYLEAVSEALEIANTHSPDILLFQAGVDGLETDALGRLSVTREGMKERNELVFSSLEGRTPCLFFMGGGYSDPIEATVDSFCDLFESAAKANSLFDA